MGFRVIGFQGCRVGFAVLGFRVKGSLGRSQGPGYIDPPSTLTPT